MPAKRMNPHVIKDVLKYEAGLSHQQVAQAPRISKGAVATYAGAAEAAGLTDWALLRERDEAVLEGRLLACRAAAREVAPPNFGRLHQERGRLGVTLALLWEDYVAAHPGQRTWGRTPFYERHHRFAGPLKRA